MSGLHPVSPAPIACLDIDDPTVVVHRGLLCFCSGGGGSGSAASQDASGDGEESSPPRIRTASDELTHPTHALSAAAAADGRLDLLADWEAQSLHASRDSTGCLVAHSAQCVPVLVKTHTSLHGTYEQTAQLRYELVVLSRLHTASIESVSPKPKPRVSLRPVLGRMRSTSVAVALAHTAATPTAQAGGSIAPHLRQLSDSRLALVFADPGGATLRQLMMAPPVAAGSKRFPARAVSESFAIAGAPQHADQVSPSSVTHHAEWPTTSSRAAAAKSQSRTAAAARGGIARPAAITLDSVQVALDRCISICSELRSMHSIHLIHQSLHPSSILLNPTTGAVVLLDLTTTSLVQKDHVESDSHIASHSAAVWRYLAPETSGKANRVTDSRSDIYSLGCILHESIAGRPPFESNDKLEVIHQHLAKAPPSLMPRGITVKSQPLLHAVLTVVQAIVAKLLQKQAEERYQSTAGLIHDLTFVRDILRDHAASAPVSPTVSVMSSSPTVAGPSIGDCVDRLERFVIGQLDSSSVFRLSQRLFGRDDELRALIRAYEHTIRVAPTTNRMVLNPRLQLQQPGSPREDADADTGMAGAASSQFFLVNGSSGSGKSVLVDELHKHILRQRGLFARGKFDLLKRDSSCLLQAFRHLVVQLIVTDAITWKVRLLRALGSNAAVICDVLPELTRLIGDQPPVPKVSTAETANRFNQVFVQFVSALATATSPLTLFIDDLQWADSGSLALLRLLFDQESAHLLLIGAYRSNEVDESHPLAKLTAEFNATHAERATEVTLRPLTTPHLVDWLCDSFRCPAVAALPLAQLLLTKTQGNPFFVSTLLRTFYEERLLLFNFDRACWEWDLESMRRGAVQEDVVQLLCKQMLTLSAESQTLLQYAACSGNTFNLHALSVITQLSLDALVVASCELEQAGMLIVTSHTHDWFLLVEACRTARGDHEDSVHGRNSDGCDTRAKNDSRHQPQASSSTRLLAITMRFAHDKIQLLLRTYDDADQEEYASDLVSHLNVGIECLTNPMSDGSSVATAPDPKAIIVWEEFLSNDDVIGRAVQIELMAGRQARASLAFDNSVQLLTTALKLVQYAATRHQPTPTAAAAASNATLAATTSKKTSDDGFIRVAPICWSHSYAWCRELYGELAACLFLTSRFDTAQRAVEYIFTHVENVFDRAPLFTLHIQCLNQQSNMRGGLDTCFAHLRELGIDLLSAITDELHEWIFSFTDVHDERTFKNHPVFSLEEMTDPASLHAMSIMMASTPALFFLGDPTFVHVALTMLHLTRTRGVAPESGYAFALYSMTIWSSHTQYAENFALGSIAKLIVENLGDAARSVMPATNACVLNPVYPWKLPLRQVMIMVDAAFDDALSLGDFEWSSHLALPQSEFSTHCNLHLPAAIAKQRALTHALIKRKMLTPARYTQSWLDFSEHMAGITTEMPPIANEFPLQLLKLASGLTRAMAHFHMRRLKEAAAAIAVAAEALPSLPSVPSNATCTFYRCIILLATCPRATLRISDDGISRKLPAGYDPQVVMSRLAEADRLIHLMSIWATHAPHNYGHKLKLMKAERHRVAIVSHLACDHLIVPAMRFYEEAVAGAHANAFSLKCAVALECSARFYLDLQRVSLAHAFLRRAYSEYAVFGAHAKLAQLQREFAMIQFSATIDNSADPSMSPVTADATDGDATSHTHADAHSHASSSSSSTSNATTRVLHPAITLQLPGHTADAASSGTSSYSSVNGSQSGCARVGWSSGSSAAGSSTAATAASSTAASSASSGASARRGTHLEFDAVSVLKATASFSTEKDQPTLLKRLMRIVLETAGATRGVLVLEDPHTKEWCVELGGSVENPSPDDRADTEEKHVDGKESSVLPSPELTTRSVDTDTSLHSSRSSASSSMLGSGTRLRLGEAAGSVSVESALPLSVFQFCLKSIESLVLNEANRDEFASFASDPYFEKRRPKAILCIPVLKAGEVFGVLYLENDFHVSAFTSSHVQLLQLLCGQAALSIDNARLYTQLESNNADLEDLVSQRTFELEERNDQLQKAKEEAEKATKIKAEFLSNMSHEIRTPMNAVLGIGRLLADTNLSLEQQQYVSMINNSGHLLLTIINDILDYSKIEAGQLQLNRQPHNIVDVVETAMMLCYDMASSKGLYISWHVDPSLPAAMMLDATRLQQILLNLLSNAIKFTKKGGVDLNVTGRVVAPVPVTGHQSQPSSARTAGKTPSLLMRKLSASSSSMTPASPLRVMPAPLTVTAATHQGNLRYQLEFSVRDTGIGISSAQLSTLFRSFSQVQHVSGEYGGTGLGLVISKRLVEAMGGGDITVDSQPSVGSTFSFSIVAPVANPLQPPDRDSPMSTCRRLSGLSSASSPSLGLRSGAAGSSSPSQRVNTASRSFVPAASSPLPRTRGLRAASGEDSATTSPPQIHGLAAADMQTLARTTVVYIGERHAASAGWIRCLEFYGCTVHVAHAIKDAVHYLQERTAHMQAASPVEAGATPLANGDNGFSRLCDAVLVDLDSAGVTEESLADQMRPFAPLRMLLLFSSKTVHSIPMDVDALAPPSPFTPVVPHLTGVPYPPSVPEHDTIIPPLPALPFEADGAPSVVMSPMPTGGSGAIPSPFLRQSPVGGTVTVPPPIASSSSFSPLTRLRVMDRTYATETTQHRSLSPTAARSITQCIRKPFKVRAFLRAVLSILSATHRDPTVVSSTFSSSTSSSSSSRSLDIATPIMIDSTRGLLSPPTSYAAVGQMTPLAHMTQLTMTPPAPSPEYATQAIAAAAAAAAGTPNKPNKIKPISKKYPLRVLLAEDNLMNQKMMVMLMRKLGYELTIAANGREVLDHLERASLLGRDHEIECILMDASMDVMDGMECTRVIREQQMPHRTRPFIIAQTANVTEEYREKCLQAGMDMFICKPIPVGDLVRCLRTAYAVHQQAAATLVQAASSPTGTHDMEAEDADMTPPHADGSTADAATPPQHDTTPNTTSE